MITNMHCYRNFPKYAEFVVRRGARVMFALVGVRLLIAHAADVVEAMSLSLALSWHQV